jgi:hypothetical protein
MPRLWYKIQTRSSHLRLFCELKQVFDHIRYSGNEHKLSCLFLLRHLRCAKEVIAPFTSCKKGFKNELICAGRAIAFLFLSSRPLRVCSKRYGAKWKSSARRHYIAKINTLPAHIIFAKNFTIPFKRRNLSDYNKISPRVSTKATQIKSK